MATREIGGSDVRRRRESGAEPSDEELVAAMREHSPDALHEFFARFAPMLDVLARVRRVPRAEREIVVTEFLDDAAMRLLSHTTPVPRALAAYLAVSFRRWHLNRERDRRRRSELDAATASDAAGGGERAVWSVVSEDARRVSQGPDHDEEERSPAVARLVLMLENELSAADRQLVEWLAQRVPQRIVAEWLGVTHGALRVRVTRLRRRLREAAARHLAALDDRARGELHRILGREGRRPGEALGAAERAAPPSESEEDIDDTR